jgi:hypothetical protein
VRGPASRLKPRLLVAGAILAAMPILPARAFGAGPETDLRAVYGESIRRLDGDQFLEDEPVWLCDASANGPAVRDAWAPPAWALEGRDATGTRRLAAPVYRRVYAVDAQGSALVPRAFEFSQTLGNYDATGRAGLWADTNGLPEGEWEIHATQGDTARVLARIEVLAPRGSERSVRDALARATRLARDLGRPKDAADLYAAVWQRYPRTAYLSAIYWGEWQVRDHTRFAHDPGRWMEEVFAHFHDTCFGVVALDRWVGDVGTDTARPVLQKLVGIYPDTPLSRAALRYL